MARITTDVSDELENFSTDCRFDFGLLLDYIWKSVRLVDHETRLESEKLEAYFPNDPARQERRWRLEGWKLKESFPFLISQGNFLSAMALFETRLLLLVKILERCVSQRLDDVRGQGTSRSLAFFAALGVLPSRVPAWEQVSAAIAIRNCVIHAGGGLQYFRGQTALRAVIAENRFLTPDIRERAKKEGFGKEFVTLFHHQALGERVVISSRYAHRLTGLLRDYLLDLCGAVRAALWLPDTVSGMKGPV